MPSTAATIRNVTVKGVNRPRKYTAIRPMNIDIMAIAGLITPNPTHANIIITAQKAPSLPSSVLPNEVALSSRYSLISAVESPVKAINTGPV